MSDFTLRRFSGPPTQENLERVLQQLSIVNPPIESPIIDPEALRSALLLKLNPQPQIKISEANPSMLEFMSFANIFEFVHWYEQNISQFTETQQKPLSNLIAARNMATGGCNCDIETRKLIASDWFKKFWINNKNTDLAPTLLKAANAKKVVFGEFLTIP